MGTTYAPSPTITQTEAPPRALLAYGSRMASQMTWKTWPVAWDGVVWCVPRLAKRPEWLRALYVVAFASWRAGRRLNPDIVLAREAPPAE